MNSYRLTADAPSLTFPRRKFHVAQSELSIRTIPVGDYADSNNTAT